MYFFSAVYMYTVHGIHIFCIKGVPSIHILAEHNMCKIVQNAPFISRVILIFSSLIIWPDDRQLKQIFTQKNTS